MRNQSVSLLLIITFLSGSLPQARAQEILPAEPIAPAVEAVEAVGEAAISEPEPELITDLPEVVADGVPVTTEVPAAPTTESEPALIIDELEATAEIPADVPEEAAPAITPSVSLTVRYGENVAWTGTTTLPESGTVSVTSTDGASTVSVAANSLLAVLMQVDESSADFAITDLDYYSNYGGSFIVDCITATTFGEACSQWQYVVDGEYSFDAMDDLILEEDDEVYVYFGSPRRVLLQSSSIVVSTPFTAIAQSYDPETNSYSPLPGYTIGITQPNPANPWAPLEIATTTSGTGGEGTFTLDLPGAYDAGLQIDGYYPSTPFMVASSSTGTGPGEGGTGGEEGGTETGLDIAAAFRFLADGQEDDGSWGGNETVTDWAAIALGTRDAPSGMKSSLASYLRDEPAKDREAIDNARQAMALMSLGINPYTGGDRDYIADIVATYNGEQIDNANIVNDDIFSLIALVNAGYDTDDDIIKNSTAFVVDEQRGDGSWVGSPSVTAAAIQALEPLTSLPGVSRAISDAEGFLRSAQRSDGGFGDERGSDPFATSWAIQAIESAGGSADEWKVGGATPLTYLASTQAEDGGIDTPRDTSYGNRAWATAYAIPAAAGLTWHDILRDFKKPAGTEEPDTKKDSDDGTASTTPKTETATSTDAVLIDPLPALLDLPEVLAAQTAIAATMDTFQASDPADVQPAQEAVAAADTESAEMATGTVPLLTASVLDSAAGESLWASIKSFFGSLWHAFTRIF